MFGATILLIFATATVSLQAESGQDINNYISECFKTCFEEKLSIESLTKTLFAQPELILENTDVMSCMEENCAERDHQLLDIIKGCKDVAADDFDVDSEDFKQIGGLCKVPESSRKLKQCLYNWITFAPEFFVENRALLTFLKTGMPLEATEELNDCMPILNDLDSYLGAMENFKSSMLVSEGDAEEPATKEEL